MSYLTGNTALILNPRFIKSGFDSQSSNICKYEPIQTRKVACYLKAISAHILKHGASCYASTDTLLNTYNENAKRYGVRPVSKRTIGNLQELVEKMGLILVDTFFDKELGIRRRLIDLNLSAIESAFEAVYNWSLQAAKRFCKRANLHLGGSGCGKPNQAKPSKGLEQHDSRESCTIRSKINSNELNKNNGLRRLSYDAFLLKFFSKDANQVKELQQAARGKRITANGARKLISIHNHHGYPLAKSFKRYLEHVIAKAHDEAKNATRSPHSAIKPVFKQSSVVTAPIESKKSTKSVCAGRSVFARIKNTWGA